MVGISDKPVRKAEAPYARWIWLGFGAAYLAFFIFPIFLSTQSMLFPQYVPASGPSGSDLRLALQASAAWLHGVTPPATPHGMELPLVAVLLAPLLAVDSHTAYVVVSVLVALAFLVLTFWLPLRMNGRQDLSPTLVLVFITGIVSYGFQFALERAQFDAIAVLLALLAVWAYRKKGKPRLLSYVFLIAAVQLKPYTFVYVVLFVEEWANWKEGARRIGLLAAANVLCMVLVWPGAALAWLSGAAATTVPVISWTNHTVASFTGLTTQVLSRHGVTWLPALNAALQAVFMLVIAGCLVLVARWSARGTEGAGIPDLILACTLAGLMIPTINEDSALAVLPAAVAVYLLGAVLDVDYISRLRAIATRALLVMFALAYASTLVSYTNKPHLLANDFPALLAMLLTVTILAWLRPQSRHAASDADSRAAVAP